MKDRPYHHGDLAAALLARAEQTLREKGAGALSLRELARDLGVSSAAPSRHFKSKQALLDALALVGFERLVAATAASQEDVGDSFAVRLGAAARAYVEFAVADAALLDLMFAVKHGPDVSAELGAAVERWAELMLAMISDGQRSGEVREGEPERVALPVLSGLHGYAGLTVSGMVPPAIAAHGLDDVVESILRGCAPQ